jgi:hypothetical protein
MDNKIIITKEIELNNKKDNPILIFLLISKPNLLISFCRNFVKLGENLKEVN